MSEFPSNSHKKANADSKENVTETKKVVKITTSDAVLRKKSLGKRFSETFVGGDAKGVGMYVVMDVLIPAAKDMVADAMSQGVERMLFGEVRSSSRRTGMRPGGSGGYINYNRPQSSPTSGYRREEPRVNPSRRARASHNFAEIILPNRIEAEQVIDRLIDLVNRYDTATVADLYDLVGADRSYTDDKWGWTDLRGAGVTRIREGYLLDLPRPEPLD